MLDDKRTKFPMGQRYVAERLLMPYGVIFPFSETGPLQDMVVESLLELEKIDPEFKTEIINEMNDVQMEKRKIKEKHVNNDDTRQILNLNRRPFSQLYF